ncbi:MAG: gamma-glutamylcyclotransferase family protein [Alkalilacustris sp.]
MRLIRTLIAAAALATGAVGVITQAPVYLPALPSGAPPIPEGKSRVFGYATLADPLVRLVVVGAPVRSEAAALPGWRRHGRDLLADPEAVTTGRVFTVDADGLRRLDRYEQAGYRYHRVKKTLADGSEAWVYGLITPRGAR